MIFFLCLVVCFSCGPQCLLWFASLVYVCACAYRQHWLRRANEAHFKHIFFFFCWTRRHNLIQSIIFAALPHNKIYLVIRVYVWKLFMCTIIIVIIVQKQSLKGNESEREKTVNISVQNSFLAYNQNIAKSTQNNGERKRKMKRKKKNTN